MLATARRNPLYCNNLFSIFYGGAFMNRIRFVLITASTLLLAAAASRQPRTKNSPRERFQSPPLAAYVQRIPDS